MDLRIRARGLELSAADHAQIERRVRFALARFGTLIAQVECLVSDTNGPRGGVDKLCTLRLQPHGTRPVVIEQADEQTLRAVDLAVDRAARAVAREIQRARTKLPRREARS